MSSKITRGDFHGSHDTLTLVAHGRFLKIVSVGDRVPGVEGSLFAGLATSHFNGGACFPEFELLLDNTGEVAFPATFVACRDTSEVASLASSTRVDGLFRFSRGRILQDRDGRWPAVRWFSPCLAQQHGMIPFEGLASSAGTSTLSYGILLLSEGQVRRVAF